MRRSCDGMTTCSAVMWAMTHGQACINARNKIMGVCFRGGNAVHQNEVVRASEILGKCAVQAVRLNCPGF